MKILYVIPDLSRATGGPVTALAGLSEAHAAMGVDVAIATTGWDFHHAPSLTEVDVHTFPCLWARWRWAPGLGTFLTEKIRNYDLVCIESLWQYPTWKAASICRAAGVPYVVSTNGMLEAWSVSQKAWKKQPYLRWFEGESLRGAAALHATSEMEYVNSAMARWNRWAVVLPLGLPQRAYTTVPKSGLLGKRFRELADNRFVLFLGRVHYKKQPEVAIGAFGRIADKFPDTVLVIAGPCEPSYITRLKELSQDLGIGERVIFTGMLEGETILQAYSAATVFILPSLQENFGLAVAEAMAMQCPVIVSDQVQLAPAITEAEAGMVRRPTVEEMSDALEHVLTNEDLRIHMGQNGRKLVLERFTWQAVAADFLDVFEDILAGTRTSSAWRDSLRAVPPKIAAVNQQSRLQTNSSA
jgi:glycosyltransferase involved in cell wall biosynthesis